MTGRPAAICLGPGHVVVHGDPAVYGVVFHLRARSDLPVVSRPRSA